MERPDRGRCPFTVRQTVALVLLVLAVIFILENRRSTTIRFLVREFTAPLWVALLGSLLVGVLAGALITRDRNPALP